MVQNPSFVERPGPHVASGCGAGGGIQVLSSHHILLMGLRVRLCSHVVVGVVLLVADDVGAVDVASHNQALEG